MKTLFITVAIVLMLTTSVFAQDKCVSSGLYLNSGVIYAKAATLCGIRAVTNGTNLTTCVVYDNKTTSSGKIVDQWTTLGANYAGGANEPMDGVTADNGLYVAITTTGGGCIITYIPVAY